MKIYLKNLDTFNKACRMTQFLKDIDHMKNVAGITQAALGIYDAESVQMVSSYNAGTMEISSYGLIMITQNGRKLLFAVSDTKEAITFMLNEIAQRMIMGDKCIIDMSDPSDNSEDVPSAEEEGEE